MANFQLRLGDYMMARGQVETTVHVKVKRDKDGKVLELSCGVRRPGKTAVEEWDEVIIHGPSRLQKTENGKRILLHTAARVEGKNR